MRRQPTVPSRPLMSIRPSILVLTRIAFWRLGAGERMRLLALMWVLPRLADVTVMHFGRIGPADRKLLDQLHVACTLIEADPDVEVSVQRDGVRALCATHRFDACIVERIALDYLREALPAGVRTVLDTHDLESVKAESRAAVGASAVESAPGFEAEVEILRRYDRVLLIQADDHARVTPLLGDKAMLAPHPVAFPRRPVRPDRRRLGFVGSAWIANVDGLDWFADRVWPVLAGSNTDVHLFGWICDVWRREAPGAYHRHGFVADFNRVWGEIDVAINPVRWGAGLKIKSIEALGNGLPLVTTTEGARGLAEGAGGAFLIADAPDAFADACVRLLDDPALRLQLGRRGYEFARERFSAERCFAPLVRWLIGG